MCHIYRVLLTFEKRKKIESQMLSSGSPKQTHPSSIVDSRPAASSAALFGPPFFFIVNELRAEIRLRGCQVGKARDIFGQFLRHMQFFFALNPCQSGGQMRKCIVRNGPPGVSAVVSLTLGESAPKRQTLICASRPLNWHLEFGHVNWENRPMRGLA